MGVRTDKQDVTAVWNDMRDRISLFKGGKRSAGQGSFAHLVGGYDAGYYGCAVKFNLVYLTRLIEVPE